MKNTSSDPIDANPPALPNGQFQIEHNRDYILVVNGTVAVAIREALDAVGRSLGADQGQVAWGIRGGITGQLASPSETEAFALGLISGREARRAAAKAQALKEESAQAVASKTADRKKK